MSLHENVLEKWLKLKSYDVSLEDFYAQLFREQFTDTGRGIALAGVPGGSLFWELVHREISSFTKVEYIIDTSNEKTIDIPETCGIGLIIVVDYLDFYSIEKKTQAKCKTNIQIHSIRELIEIAFFLKFLAPAITAVKNGTPIYCIRWPQLSNLDPNTYSQYEKMIQDTAYTVEQAKENPANFRIAYEELEEYSDRYIQNVFYQPPIVSRKDREGFEYLVHSDYRSQWVNIIQGSRLTVDQPEKCSGSIHMFGNCQLYGFGMEDQYTVASQLQRKANDQGHKIKVFNYGVWGTFLEDHLRRIRHTNIDTDDMIVIMDLSAYLPVQESFLYDFFRAACLEYGVIYIDISYALQYRNPDKPIWIDKNHLNHNGNDLIADELLNQWKAYLHNQSGRPSKDYHIKETQSDRQIDSVREDKELKEYVSRLQKVRVCGVEKAGSIVVNCNPFTLGHRYLIEYASSQVAHLYVFVVEEDRSFFPFSDRLQLVRQGVADLKNVTVVPSGKYIISTVTFPQYFSKDTPESIEIDMSMDVELFAQVIAPALGIKKRFAGYEPFCQVTRQYNNAMRDTLPQYGIEFIEIPRMELSL